MKKVIRLLIFMITLFLSVNKTLAYYDISDYFTNVFNSKDYSINIGANGGTFSNPSIVVKNNKTTLPTPTRTGYTFNGYVNLDNQDITYSTEILNIDEINNSHISAIWSINSYVVDVNSIIDGTAYNSGLSGYTFDVWVNGEQVADDVIDWYQSVSYGSSIRIKTNNATGRTTNYDKSFTLGANQLNINPTWTSNTYEGHFYLNGVHRLTTYNKYGSTITKPNTSAGALGYDSNFYYLNGFTAWTTWTQPDYAVGFTINIAEYNCIATFGTRSVSNANSQLTKLRNAGYNICYVSGSGVVCPASYSSVVAVYNNAWNILPTSGSGYSIYKSMSCDSGWGIEQKR